MAHIGFKKLSAMLEKKGISNPRALAANIGRKKYGTKKMTHAAATHTVLRERDKKKG